MKVIGLTGGIGSGKSTIGRVLETIGLPVFDADREALVLYEEDDMLLMEVKERFGDAVLQPNGGLNRQALAAIVFKDEHALRYLNALVHPRVAQRFAQWKEKQTSAAVVREAAILFESGSDTDCDAVIVVTAPQALRIARVQKRNGMSEEEVRSRMNRQWPEEELVKRADAVIVNDDHHLVVTQLMHVIQNIVQQ